MKVCPKCGTSSSDTAKFCTACGAPLDAGTKTNPNDWTRIQDTADTTSAYDPTDIAQNKAVAIFAYLSWLVVIPLVGARSSPFVRFHANQGLLLCLTGAVLGAAKGLISLFTPRIIDRMLDFAYSAVSVGLFVLAVIGLVNVLEGRAKALPLIGHLKILS